MSPTDDSAIDRPTTRRPWVGPARLGLAVLVGLAILLAPGHARADEDPAARIEALAFEEPPVIDGTLSEWALDDAEHTGRIDKALQALPGRHEAWEGPEDLSAVFQVGVDDQALYMACRITDDTLFHPGQPWWTGDSVEVFLDLHHRTPGEGRAERYDEDCWQIFLMPLNPDLAWGVAMQGGGQRFDDAGLRGVRVAHRRRPDGYDIEARFPLENFGIDPTEARTIGFAVALNDADAEPGDPGTYLSWNSRFELYRCPDHFGTLVLPARAATAPASSSGSGGSVVLWIVLSVVVLSGSVLLLAGPGARAFARLGPTPKAVGLALTGLLAIVYAVDAERTEARAERDVRRDLQALAEEAQAVARDAAALGALPAWNAPRRTDVLADLLRGHRVSTVLPPEEVAFAALRDLEAAAAGPRYRLPLGGARTFYFPEPVSMRTLALNIEVEARRPREEDALGATTLGAVVLDHASGSSESCVVEVDAADPSAQRVEVPLETEGPWKCIHWHPSPGAPPAVLLGAEVPQEDVETASTPLLLTSVTEDGVAILGGPGTPPLDVALAPGEETSIALPYLLGADRVWIVLTAEDAFPRTLGDDTVARIVVSYDRDDSEEMVVRNGEHVVAERLPLGIQRPPEMRGRVAYRWTDRRGQVHAHDAIAMRLDPTRRALRLGVSNAGGAGRLRLMAVTVVRSGVPPADSLLGLAPGGTDGVDEVFVLRPVPGFAERLGPGGEEGVRFERLLGPEAMPTAVTLSAPLPPKVATKRERTRIALFTCLALALVLLAFLAADAVERFPRLTLRLAFAVLVAALVPLCVTILLLDRTTRDRLEAEHAARARTALSTVEEALEGALGRTREDARNLARHLASEPETVAPHDVARLVRLYRKGALPAGTASLALVTETDRPTLSVPGDEPTATLQGPRWFVERSHHAGLHASPWDGLLLLGCARYGPEERWVRVALGVRADDAFLGELARGGAPDAAVALLDASGAPLAAAGPGGDDFLAALARSRDHLPVQRGGGVLGRVEAVGLTGHPRLAALTRLDVVGDPADAPWLAVGLDRTDIDETLAAQREQLAWLALFGIVLVVGVASLTARRVADPVKELVRVTEAVRRGEFDVEVPPAGTDEVGDLTVAFDQMRHDLKHRVADLDFLRRAQEALAGSLDYGRRAAVVVDLMHGCFEPDSVVLLDAASAGGPLTIAAEYGRRTTFSDRPFRAAPGGWIEAALAREEALSITAPGEDERVAAEGPLGARLVEERPTWLAVPLRTGGETSGLVVMGFDDPEALPTGAARRLLDPLAGICALALYNARLYRLAALDDVTRLPGSTAFEAALRADVEGATSGGKPVVLLRIGLDNIEHVTLRRGVLLARALLRSLALALREVVPDLSQLARLREDEFAVRLPDSTRVEALACAERVRERLSRVEVAAEDDAGDPVGSTVSVGVARGPDDAVSLEFLLDAAGRALAAARREGGDHVEDAARLDAGLVDLPPYEEGAVIRSEKMVRVVEAARRAARTDASVLLTGETGTGKEVIADLIHRRSVRAEHPFVKVNCAAFPETLLESELFGYERGAFTGAERRRQGRFELADGGTLFLDEIAEMSPSAQVKLLRVLQEHQITRLGGTRPVSVNVRLVAATNRDLDHCMAEGSFREDLYYRLNVIRLDLPPLRERREEIPLLVEAFLADAVRRAGRGPKGLTAASMDVLYRHPWPGNVRELKNAIERCVVMCDATEAGPEHLRLDGSRSDGTPAPRAAPRDELNERQKALLDHLARHGRCTNREYYEMTSTSPRTGLRDLQDLMARGLLIREGRRRGAVYRLPP